MPDRRFPALTAAVDAALAGIRDDPGPRAAYDQATALGRLARALLDEAARARGQALIRMQDTGQQTLTEVAAEVGMSKQSAAGLMNRARIPRSRDSGKNHLPVR